MNVQRAYSLFEVKELDDQKRVFTGWATTPTPDRYGDTVNPLGAKFANPLPLLHQHNHGEPIGLVNFSAPTAKGIQFQAEIPTIADEGPLKDRVDTAWGEIKNRLVRAVSIGFRAVKYAFRDDGGIDFQEIEIYELSAVTVPALPDAVITEVKAMSDGRIPRTVLEQIKSLDFGARKSGSVRLITPESQTKNLNGAVRLIRP